MDSYLTVSLLYLGMLPPGGAIAQTTVAYNPLGVKKKFQVSDIHSFVEPFSYNLIFSTHYTISLKIEMTFSNYQISIIFKTVNFQIIKSLPFKKK